jgi:hypothetical protein
MDRSQQKNIFNLYYGNYHHYSFGITGGIWKFHIIKTNSIWHQSNFKHVSYLWDDAEAAKLAGDEVGLLIYRSNILGADLRLTNYGGGNTSCKVMAKDPLTG